MIIAKIFSKLLHEPIAALRKMERQKLEKSMLYINLTKVAQKCEC